MYHYRFFGLHNFPMGWHRIHSLSYDFSPWSCLFPFLYHLQYQAQKVCLHGKTHHSHFSPRQTIGACSLCSITFRSCDVIQYIARSPSPLWHWNHKRRFVNKFRIPVSIIIWYALLPSISVFITVSVTISIFKLFLNSMSMACPGHESIEWYVLSRSRSSFSIWSPSRWTRSPFMALVRVAVPICTISRFL